MALGMTAGGARVQGLGVRAQGLRVWGNPKPKH